MRWLVCALACLAFGACAPEHVLSTRREPSSARSYRVVMRRDQLRSQPRAALFLLHAYSISPDDMLRRFRLIERAVHDRDWLLVLPQGELDANGKLAWNASAACCGEGAALRQRDDLAYLRSVLADLRAHFTVDPQRVYALGVSNGAFMAQRWACSPHAGLRAIVSVAGAAPGPDDPPCAASEAVSVLHMHGTDDKVIRYAGDGIQGARYPGADATVALWRKLARASGPGQERWWRTLRLESVHEQRWQGERARVWFWSVQGAEHHLRAVPFEIEAFLEFLERS